MGHPACEPVSPKSSPPRAQVCNSGTVTPSWGTGPGATGAGGPGQGAAPGLPGRHRHRRDSGQHSDVPRPSGERLGVRSSLKGGTSGSSLPVHARAFGAGEPPGTLTLARAGGQVPSQASGSIWTLQPRAPAPTEPARPRLSLRRPPAPSACVLPASRVLTCLPGQGGGPAVVCARVPPHRSGSGEEPPTVPPPR